MSTESTHELTITVRGNDKIKAKSKGGAEEWGELDFDPLRQATVEVLEGWLVRNYTVREINSWMMQHVKGGQRRELEVLGRHLYAAIFNGGIPGLFKEQLDKARAAEARLRLQLSFEKKKADLINLPWEFLYSADRKVFLATDVDLILTRFIPLSVDREPLDPQESPLNILIVISRPESDDLGPVTTKDVVTAIENLSKDENLPPIAVHHLEQPNLNTLEEALRTYKPHIFHFIGHGDFFDGTGRLALVDENNEAEWCTAPMLIETFMAANAYPRLVFLHMCEGGDVYGESTALHAFSGFAPDLIHAKIPSVVAMRYPIKNKDAKEFSLAFYHELAKGGIMVDAAVQVGRFRLDRSRTRGVFGTPVLYMHSSDGIIMKPTPEESTPARPASFAQGAAQDHTGTAQRDRNGHRNGPAAPSLTGAPPSRGTPAPSGNPVLRAILDAGQAQLDALNLDDPQKYAINKLLWTMEYDFSELSPLKMGNRLYRYHGEQTDPQVKAVLSAMMDVLDDLIDTAP